MILLYRYCRLVAFEISFPFDDDPKILDNITIQ